MGIEHDIAGDWHAALAALAWQVELGLTDIRAETPLDRYDLPEPVKAPPPAPIIAAAETPRRHRPNPKRPTPRRHRRRPRCSQPRRNAGRPARTPWRLTSIAT